LCVPTRSFVCCFGWFLPRQKQQQKGRSVFRNKTPHTRTRSNAASTCLTRTPSTSTFTARRNFLRRVSETCARCTVLALGAVRPISTSW
ncbi:unnamed protein product, partial [Ascophyllum nodosum]